MATSSSKWMSIRRAFVMVDRRMGIVSTRLQQVSSPLDLLSFGTRAILDNSRAFRRVVPMRDRCCCPRRCRRASNALCLSASILGSRAAAPCGPELVSRPRRRGGVVRALAPVSDPGAGGLLCDCPGVVVVDCPGVGAGVGPVPLGTRLSVLPVARCPGLGWERKRLSRCRRGRRSGAARHGAVQASEVPGADPVADDPVPALPAPPAPGSFRLRRRFRLAPPGSAALAKRTREHCSRRARLREQYDL